MHLPPPPWRRRTVRAAAAFTAAALLTALPLADTDAVAAPSAKVDPALSAAVAEAGDTSFFVVLKDQADLSSVRKQQTHAAKARAAYGALTAHARKARSRSIPFSTERRPATRTTGSPTPSK